MDADKRLASAYARGVPSTPHLEEVVFERLLDDELGPTDREAALDHVTSCPECAAVYRGLVEFEREARAFDPTAPGVRAKSATPFMRVPVWFGAIAASIALAVVGWTVTRPSRAPQPIALVSRAEPVAVAPAISIEKLAVRISGDRALGFRSAGDDPKAFLTDFGRALEPYRADQFDEAARRLRELGAKYPTAVEPPLYEGVSLLLLRRPAEAVGPLERAVTLATEDEFRKDAEYYGALAGLEAGQPGGRDALARICSAEGPYRTNACDVLQSRPAPPR